MGNCAHCAYAKRDKKGRFLDQCAGYGNCTFDPYEGEVTPSPIDQMRELFASATVSKFATPEACQAFKDGVSQCIQIMEEENNSRQAEKGTGSVGAEMVRRMIAQYEG